MMTLRRLSVGAGVKYLFHSIARGDGPKGADKSSLVRYYTDSGTPPGRFLGAGLAGLNVVDGVALGVAEGTVVTEEQLQRMLGELADPITGEALGARPRNFKKSDEGGRRPQALGGFDLTFSPSKSVSVAWAMADEETREIIYRCHQEAIAKTIAYAEREVFHSRSGENGNTQEKIRGVVAASFTHFDSRSGDCQLHDHVVLMNRAQSVSDGKWRTLDSRGLYKSAVMLSEMHQGVLSDLLTKELGWGWEAHSRRASSVPKWEVAGVPEDLMAEFSQRSDAILEEKDRLISEFVEGHGRQPTAVEVLTMRQTATISTRHAKVGHSLGDLTRSWVRRARPFIGDEPMAWVASLSSSEQVLVTADSLSEEILADLAESSLVKVGEKRPTFTRMNLAAEITRQLHGVRFVDEDDRFVVIERTTELAARQSLLLSTPDLHHVPASLRNSDGTSKFRPKNHEVFTTTLLLDAETRLLEAGRSLTAPIATMATVAEITDRVLPGKTFKLSGDQALVVEKIATSGRNLDLLVGPAGTGKSTTMRGLREVWERDHGTGSVVGLAPSAAAAEVLGEELGIDTDNVAKWLHEHRGNGERYARLRELRDLREATGNARAIHELEDAIAKWSFQPGQLVMVDEASLASTFSLDELVSAAGDAGAKVVLVGDWAQLASVDAGGMFRTLATDRGTGAPTLTDVRRFEFKWEKEASLQLRRGSTAALRAYEGHDRITSGFRVDMIDAVYAAWRRDTEAGLTSLMLAGDAKTVRELNTRARRDNVLAGQVAAEGVNIAHGMDAGVNDCVVTRENRRAISAGRGWVKNGDVWTVIATHPDGALTVTRAGKRSTGTVVLPADYVTEHVELAYASTTHRAQGRTVDTAHAFVDATTSREVLYVGTTRGKTSNQLYVDTHYDPDPSTSHDELTPAMPVLEVLERVLSTELSDVSATDAFARELTARDAIPTLVAEYNTIAKLSEPDRWDAMLAGAGLSVDELAAVKASAAYGPLAAALRHGQAVGAHLEEVLGDLVGAASLDSAEDPAAVLHYRVQRYIEEAGYKGVAVGDLVAGLFPRAHVDDVDMAQALLEREVAIESSARSQALRDVALSVEWTMAVAPAPDEPEAYDAWLTRLATIAAYREQWNISSSEPLGEPDAQSITQLGHYRRAQAAYAALLAEPMQREEYVVAGDRQLEQAIDPRGPELSL